MNNWVRHLLYYKNGIKSSFILGYTKEDLIKHIESKFLSGMTWKNHGLGRGKEKWHIDHIKPIKAFLDEGITDPKIICALDNLQPLWAVDNIRKGSKYNSDAI